MAEYIVDKHCFFCEKFQGDSRFIQERCGIWFCSSETDVIPFTKKCFSFGEQYDTASEVKECPICLMDKNLIKLPTCTHEICIDCCKTNYFGTSQNKRQMNWEEYMMKYEVAVPDNIDDEQYEYYEEYKWENSGYTHVDESDETIKETDISMQIENRKIIRDDLKNNRPTWMNTESFIDFENKEIEFWINMSIVEDRWKEYKKNMVISDNQCCPMCRAKPNWSDDELCE